MRLQVAGLIAFVGVGCAAIIGLHLVMTRPAEPDAPSRDSFQVFTTILESGLLASTGSDVAVLVRSSGALLVFRKGLREPMSLGSTDELKAVLRGQPSADTATMFVERRSTGPRTSQPELIDPSDLNLAESEIRKVLQNSGVGQVTLATW
jgi:hypothetical protein